MKYNLTETQKDALRWIVSQIESRKVEETFSFEPHPDWPAIIDRKQQPAPEGWRAVTLPKIRALAAANLLHVKDAPNKYLFYVVCTVTGLSYEAVRRNFADDAATAPVSTLAQPHPPEIAMSIDRFRTKFPDPKKVGFLVMRFAASKPFARIVDVIRRTGEKHGLALIRADENEFHADLWGNVRTYLHGCGFGIAIYERIESDEPNANVGLEVGYLLAMNKPVLLLKDKTVETLQADLAGRLYKQFDPHDPENTIPAQLEKWLSDNGIILSK
jgi:hypothetical protein